MEDTSGGLGRNSYDEGGCGEAGDGDGSRCGRRTSAPLSRCGGEFNSGGADGLEGGWTFVFSSWFKRPSGERRRGGLRRDSGVRERRRRSREAGG